MCVRIMCVRSMYAKEHRYGVADAQTRRPEGSAAWPRHSFKAAPSCRLPSPRSIIISPAHTHSHPFPVRPALRPTRLVQFLFPDYNVEELEQIAQCMLRQQGFSLADEAAKAALRRLVAPIIREDPCGNARSVENRVAATISSQSTRLRDQWPGSKAPSPLSVALAADRAALPTPEADPSPETSTETSVTDSSVSDPLVASEGLLAATPDSSPDGCRSALTPTSSKCLFELTAADLDAACRVCDRASAVLRSHRDEL